MHFSSDETEAPETRRDERPGPLNPFREFEKDQIEQSIPDRFEQQARKFPDRLAVKTRQYQLTYDELNRGSNRLAHAVIAQNRKPESPVVLLFKQEAAMIVTGMAVLKAGMAYVPVDFTLPLARAARIVQELETGLIVADNANLSMARELAPSGSKVLGAEDLDDTSPDQRPKQLISPDQIAYIHYTSGSTGQPKGVIQSHRNELHNVMTNTNALHIASDDRISLLRSNNVGASRDTLTALLNGAALISRDLKEEGLANLADWLIEEEITVYTCVTTIFRHSVRTCGKEQRFSNVRLIHVGGEAVDSTDVELYKRHFSDDCLFVSRLGISETETLTYYFINKETKLEDDVVPVGYPLEGNEILLLDDERREVGADRIGEIAVRSLYLALGYWRQPERTVERFLPDPKEENRRIYFTGDLGYMRSDGCLVHIGRKDTQVKIRGHRVEVKEVETVLLGVPGVGQAAVVVREDAGYGLRLVAYILPETERLCTSSEVYSVLREKLPMYMFPSSIEVLESFPLTPSGKIDRQALPPPERSRVTLASTYIPARTSIEEVLVRFLADILGKDEVGVLDNFWELGANSLTVAEFMTRLNDALFVSIPPHVLFDRPTVAQLSEWLIENEPSPGRTDKVAKALLKIEGMDPEEISRAVRERRELRGDD